MKKVKFELLKDYSTTGLVIEGLEINNEENRIRVIEKMNEVFTDIGLFTNGLKVVDLLFIDGNVLGKEGRPDWLMVLNDTNDKMDRDVQINNTVFIEKVDKFMFNKKFDYDHSFYPDWARYNDSDSDNDLTYNANWNENWIEKYVRDDIADIVAAAVLGKN